MFLFIVIASICGVVGGNLDFGNGIFDDTVYATKHNNQISLEEFYDNNHLHLPRPDLSNQLYIELNMQGVQDKNVSNKAFYKKVAKNLRMANPLVNVIKLNGGYNVCFKNGTANSVVTEYKKLRKTFNYVIKYLRRLDVKIDSIVFSVNLINANISDTELDEIREQYLVRRSNNDFVHIEIRGVPIVFVDELVTQIECEATSRWPQKTRKPPEIIDNLLK
ncbi:unnamed protein product [Bursaphelenchus okinawaensis]|uniref:Uncharacterized protein n=1 Tax=Bursaphelenchus okinawaensis TaxID=465554 RepID=A0A811L677_9BILA|nr:unnamed protein product [Bursaphelenchus okinawaensis]CAG9118777.1 unnamed protein product [Bursaphelenchus okinawaensis]